jgi:hypothetical protein
MIFLYYTGLLCIVPSLVLLVPYMATIYEGTGFDVGIWAEWFIILIYLTVGPAVLMSIVGICVMGRSTIR